MAFCNSNMNDIDRNECIGNSLPKINENFQTVDSLICELSSQIGASEVTQIIAGSNITISPSAGTGAVTINSSAAGESLSGINVGTGAKVYKQKTGSRLEFKTLVPGNTNVTLVEDTNSIKIYAAATSGSGGEANTSSNLGAGFGVAAPKISTDLPFKSLVGGTGVVLTSSTNTITVSNSTVNVGAGQGQLIKATSGNLPIAVRTLQQGSNIAINTSGDVVTISSTSGGVTGAANIGVGQGQVYASQSGSTLNFKTIRAGSGVVVTNNANDIQIDATGAGGGEANTASNLGTSLDGAGLFTTKTGVNLPFKRIKGGTGVTVTEETNSVTINAAAGGDISNGQNVGTGFGVFSAKSGSNLQFKSIAPTGSNITVSEASNTLTINAPNVITDSKNIAGATGSGSIVPATTKDGNSLQFKKIRAGVGLSVTDGATDVTITNSAPGITYTGGTGITVSGTTITNSAPAVPQGLAKAWVVFAQGPSNSSFSVLRSYNATAITAGVGMFKITLTSGPGNTNYVCVHSSAFGVPTQAITTYEDYRIFNNFDPGTEVPRTATSVYLSTVSSSDGRSSSPFISVLFYW